MNILKNLRAIFSPVSSLPAGEVQLAGSRPVQLIAAPAQPAAPVVTAGPGLARGNPPDLDQHIRAIGGMSVKDFMAATSQVRAQASRGTAARPGASRPAVRAKAAPASLTDDDGVPVPAPVDDPENPPGINEIISQLLDLVLELKKQVSTTPADDAEARTALGEMAAGRKLTCSRALMKLTERLCKAPRLSPQAKIARGFNSQPKVAALNSILSRRPGTSPAPAAVAVSTPPAAVASPSDRLAKIAALKAEMSSLDDSMKKSFIYDAKSVARQQQIRAELKRLKAR